MLASRDGGATRTAIPIASRAPPPPHPSPPVFSRVMRRRRGAGSLLGGIPQTQEMLDFCAAHGIVSDIEMIGIQDINTACERVLLSDVSYRFVTDMASLKAEGRT